MTKVLRVLFPVGGCAAGALPQRNQRLFMMNRTGGWLGDARAHASGRRA
jgi:hypothetical protein